MLVLSLITLALATIAAYLSIKTQEEIFKVGMAGTSLISGLLTLWFAPWELKVLIVIIPLVLDKIFSKSREHWTN